MGLQGTLKDFALPDILQLIGIQRKTGILTMDDEQDTVTVQFFQGNVVGADTRLRTLEDLLGSVLVRTGKITDAQLREVLTIQKQTLQRLGYILVKAGMLSDDELREALRIQVNQIVYRLFRWRDGRYEFTAMDHLEYDRHLIIPVPAENVLMEAARMIDEWPIIERRIRSPRMVFRKSALGHAFDPKTPGMVDGGFDLDLPGSSGKPDAAAPSDEEREVLTRVDGRATVQDIVDHSAHGEFDVHRVLYELLRRELIEEVPPDDGTRVQTGVPLGERIFGQASQLLIACAALAALATLGSNPLAPWRIGAARSETDSLRAYASRGRLERIEAALQMFYLDTGAVPDTLDVLEHERYLEGADLDDPWGRAYSFEPSADGYRLLGAKADGNPSEDLTLVHRFTPSERMILEGPALAGQAKGRVRP